MTRVATETVKACLFNLIIYTHESRREEYLHKLVHTVIEKFPCRIIFIELEKSSTVDFLNITVSKEFFQNGESIACDQITINASADKASQIPFIVLEYIVPDLPVYLFWAQNPKKENPLLQQLLKFSSRLVFDADCTDNLQNFSREILAQLDEYPIDMMDLDWAFLGRWRYVLRQTFESDERIRQLLDATEIKITYNQVQNPFLKNLQTRAIYLQGWLASRFKWNCRKIETEGDVRTIHYEGRIIKLIPGSIEEVPPGAIIRIEFTNELSESILIERSLDQPKVTINVTKENRCELPYSLPLLNPQRGLTFMKEIFFYAPSEHYRKMLEKISESCWEG